MISGSWLFAETTYRGNGVLFHRCYPSMLSIDAIPSLLWLLCFKTMNKRRTFIANTIEVIGSVEIHSISADRPIPISCHLNSSGTCQVQSERHRHRIETETSRSKDSNLELPKEFQEKKSKILIWNAIRVLWDQFRVFKLEGPNDSLAVRTKEIRAALNSTFPIINWELSMKTFNESTL